ncbi:hypothetical protein A1A1_17140 [Planococcus antarcticus DSM 14505]|uniref:Uncharacterized protein n=1 Tax=Planococcus antarcticus DSM 14505 TaxID=1185653 RepID=A0AA87IIC8_9BACL|nr:hypothetical protein [Planococcus antarcticus]EIM05275.1 hypothetical protein A1A1_17140 [Planococcus antarcticus DSM 14505]
MKKLMTILTAVLLLFAGIFMIIHNLNNEELETDPQMVVFTEQQVQAHSTTEKGYTNHELAVIKSSGNPKDSQTGPLGYTVKVVFVDEPGTSDYYQAEEHKVTCTGNSGGHQNM